MPDANEKRKEFEEIPEEKVELEQETKKNIRNKLVQVINYLQLNYEFRYNLVTALTEYREVNSDSKEYHSIDDHLFSNLIIKTKIESGVDVSDSNFNHLLKGYVGVEYDPLSEFIFKLPAWDGQRDYIREYLEQVQLKNEEKRQFFIRMFTKWFVCLVASLVTEELRNDLCLILVSPEQAKRKTTFLNCLVPKELRLKYSYNGNYQLSNNKDHEEMIGTKILINIDELDVFNRTDQRNA